LLGGPEKAGVGGSIPSLATIYNQWFRWHQPKPPDFGVFLHFSGMILFSVTWLPGTMVAYWSRPMVKALVGSVNPIESADMNAQCATPAYYQ
jgi:hypothetical protein